MIKFIDLLSLFLAKSMTNVGQIVSRLADIPAVSNQFVLRSHRQLSPHVKFGKVSQSESRLFDFFDDFTIFVDVLVLFNKIPLPFPGVFRDWFLHFV